ncbi:hypothetical protein PybrP1_007420 [[Pythium] brassicae (nom. inval.)]|nr:hypothetical protein PybrP1_007420 [[Pythium] brassicae (nom. inval.)]
MSELAPSSTFLLRACVLLLLLIVSLVQLLFFAFLPEIRLHAEFCNGTALAARSSSLLLDGTSAALRPPVRLFYQSLYLSPADIARQAAEEEKRRQEEAEAALALAAAHAATATPTPKIRGKSAARLAQLQREQEKVAAAAAAAAEKEEKAKRDKLAATKGFFLQSLGQGHEPLNSTSAYCINLVAPSDSPGVLLDHELYLNALPSSRAIYATAKEPVEMPPSVIDIYLERHPVDKKYYKRFHAPQDKAIWMMQNVEFFDRHEIAHPTVGVMIAKNRVGLKKLVEYRQRHQLSYSVFYTKHTSEDVFQPAVKRDWNAFLHLAGWSPFKNTRVIVQAWAQHPEWPTLVLRVIKSDICAWIEDTFTRDGAWRLANVDYKCGAEPLAVKNELQNRIGLHLCPSVTEGFGHYINEARGVGALVLTTDVAPMNELVDAQSGVLVGRARTWWWQTKGDLFMPLAHVEVADIEQGVEQILLLSVDERQRMGRRARAQFLADRAYFLNAMAALEESLCHDEIRVDKLLPYLY